MATSPERKGTASVDTRPLRTVADVVAALSPQMSLPELPRPPYTGQEAQAEHPRLALPVESMKRHMTDEGWQIMQGLDHGGYVLCGHGMTTGGDTSNDVRHLLKKYSPSVMVVQDKREWEGMTAGGRRGFDQRERFLHVGDLARRHDTFKLTVLKDAQHNPAFHSESAAEMGCHAWITYYHGDIVKRVAPYVRRRDLIRTYHTHDQTLVPAFKGRKHREKQCLLSGAVSSAYPLRTALVRAAGRDGAQLKGIVHLPHPGYHRNGCHTPEFLQTLARYRVAICTSSMYGYTLRKIIEATACGCRVITDLPTDDVLPFIDGNLTRVSSLSSPRDISELAIELAWSYDDDVQADHAVFSRWYDYRLAGRRLAQDIENHRAKYDQAPVTGGP